MDAFTKRHRWQTPEERARETVSLLIERKAKEAHEEIRGMADEARKRLQVYPHDPYTMLGIPQFMEALSEYGRKVMSEQQPHVYQQGGWGLGAGGLGWVLGDILLGGPGVPFSMLAYPNVLGRA